MLFYLEAKSLANDKSVLCIYMQPCINLKDFLKFSAPPGRKRKNKLLIFQKSDKSCYSSITKFVRVSNSMSVKYSLMLRDEGEESAHEYVSALTQ